MVWGNILSEKTKHKHDQALVDLEQQKHQNDSSVGETLIEPELIPRLHLVDGDHQLLYVVLQTSQMYTEEVHGGTLPGQSLSSVQALGCTSTIG